MSDPGQADDKGEPTAARAKHFEVLIAAYLFVDPARNDYDAHPDAAQRRRDLMEQTAEKAADPAAVRPSGTAG